MISFKGIKQLSDGQICISFYIPNFGVYDIRLTYKEFEKVKNALATFWFVKEAKKML
jgi:hypothetical protein